MQVESMCKVCGSLDTFDLAGTGMAKRRRGYSWREAFPDMPEHRIRQLSESICQACQEDADAAPVAV